VSNALKEVKAQVKWVATKARGAGVTELLEHLLAEDIAVCKLVK
jgi:hypothetical protein